MQITYRLEKPMLALITTFDLFLSTLTALPRLLVLPLTLMRSFKKFSYKSHRKRYVGQARRQMDIVITDVRNGKRNGN